MESRVFLDSFTLAWEQRKLGEVVSVYDGVHQTPDYKESGIMFLSVEDITSLRSEKYISEEAFKKDYKVYPQKGDILMTRIGDVGTTNVVETTEKLAFYVSLALLKPNGINSYFLSNAIQSPLFQKGLKDRTLVTAIPQKINKDEIGKVDLILPKSVVEQKRIGEYFRNLDNLITLHQCKESAFSEWKDSGFLQKHKTTWEQRKLGEFGKATGGTSIESEFDELGKYKVISIGSYSEASKYTDQGIRVNKTNKTESRILSKNDLTMILNDKTASGNIIGRVLLIDADDSYVFNQRTERIEVYKNEFLPEFLYQLLNADNIREKIIRASQGNTQIYVNWTSISELSYKIPLSKHEQRKIAALFTQLDNFITLHQRKPFCINRRQKWKQTTKMQNYSANIMQNGFQYIRKGR